MTEKFVRKSAGESIFKETSARNNFSAVSSRRKTTAASFEANPLEIASKNSHKKGCFFFDRMRRVFLCLHVFMNIIIE